MRGDLPLGEEVCGSIFWCGQYVDVEWVIMQGSDFSEETMTTEGELAMMMKCVDEELG